MLLRHGETSWNAENRFQGQSDTPLSPLGVQQAIALARRLEQTPLDAFYASDLSRAVDTAGFILAGRGLDLIEQKDLREISFGSWEGLTSAEVTSQRSQVELWSRYRADPMNHRPPGGETLQQLESRVVSALERIVGAHPGQMVALATHGGVIKAAVVWALGLALERRRQLTLDNASITCLKFQGAEITLDRLNDAAHLEKKSAELHPTSPGLFL